MNLDNEQIEGLVAQYKKESKAIKAELINLSWFMRGGLQYDDAYLLSQEEREIISKLVEDNMETTKKSGLPFF